MRVLLSLGSNLGDRTGNLQATATALDGANGIRVLAVSRVYETEPVGVLGQPEFLNQALEIETALEPLELLDVLQEIEHRLGRRPTVRWGPRVIDVDIILWEDRIVESVRLTIPHREFRKRAFVLVPLAEIASNAWDPVSHKTVVELAAQLGHSVQPEASYRVRLHEQRLEEHEPA